MECSNYRASGRCPFLLCYSAVRNIIRACEDVVGAPIKGSVLDTEYPMHYSFQEFRGVEAISPPPGTSDMVLANNYHMGRPALSIESKTTHPLDPPLHRRRQLTIINRRHLRLIHLDPRAFAPMIGLIRFIPIAAQARGRRCYGFVAFARRVAVGVYGLAAALEGEGGEVVVEEGEDGEGAAEEAAG